ncbi:hypothetical protein L6Q96_08120 [Candidatus Binatia bacterium]|nr:hypothetical protein [Candidatus Binatia bacterium]
MPQDAVSVALLGEVEAALSALAPEEERALRLRFALGAGPDTSPPISPDQAHHLEARALTRLRSASMTGEDRSEQRRQVTGYASRPGRPAGSRRPPTHPDRDEEAAPRPPERTPESPPAYDVTGWDEA